MLTSFTDNNSCIIRLPDIAPTSFRTLSDALFASIIFKYTDTTLELFGDLLDIFHRPEFNSKDVTVMRPEECMEIVAEQRRAAALKRESQSLYPYQDLVPNLVVDLLANYLESERTPFRRMVTAGGICESESILRNMTFVHRSWTNTAQRCLRRRVSATGYKQLRPLLHSPQLGPWVRDLRLGRHRNDFSPLHVSHPTYRDTSRLIFEIIKRCPNVTDLSVKGIYPSPSASRLYPPPIPPPHDFFRHLSQLTHLEHLWLSQSSEDTGADVRELTKCLSCLRNLRSFSIQGWLFASVSESVDGEQPPPERIRPSRTLKSLSLIEIYDASVLTYLGNYFRGCELDVLELSLHDTLDLMDNDQPDAASETYPHIPYITPHVTSLMLRCSQLMPSHHTSRIWVSLDRLTPLKSLCICLSPSSFLPPDGFALPGSVHSLQIHYTGTITNEALFHSMQGILMASPQARRVLLTYSDSIDFWGDGPPNDDDDIMRMGLFFINYCRESEVEFKLKEINGFPSFLDLQTYTPSES